MSILFLASVAIGVLYFGKQDWNVKGRPPEHSSDERGAPDDPPSD